VTPDECDIADGRVVHLDDAVGDSTLPAAVLSEAQRILDRAARRLLDARMHCESSSAPTRSNVYVINHSSDERPLLVDKQVIPVVACADRQRRACRVPQFRQSAPHRVARRA
jgi:hypothetical protein